MANIGSFKLKDGKYTGTIRTLTINTAVVLVPTDATGTNAPDYRLYAGKSDLGAAWKKTSNDGKDYVSVLLDDPTLPAPIYAALFVQDDGSYNLIWNRQKPAQS